MEKEFYSAWTWHGIPYVANGRKELFWNELSFQYNSPYRKYHNLNHINNCLQKLDSLHFLDRESKLRLRLAIFYHDVLYDPNENDNEGRSAAFFMSHARSLFLDNSPTSGIWEDFHPGGTEGIKIKPRVEEIVSLIKSTKFNSLHLTKNEKYLHDIDYLILASDEEEYNSYRTAIRKEYRHFPDDFYYRGRLNFLQVLQTKDKIFETEFYCRNYEDKARDNIQTEIRRIVG